MPDIAVQLSAELLTTDTEARTFRARIASVGVASSTHRVRLAAGDVLKPRQPLNRVKLLIDHDKAQPVGYMLDYDLSGDGIEATFTVAPGAAGDAALDGIASGTRDGLSVGFTPRDAKREGQDIVIRDAELYEVSLVAIPDFADAVVLSLDDTTAPVPDLSPDGDSDMTTTEAPTTEAPKDVQLATVPGIPASAPASKPQAHTLEDFLDAVQLATRTGGRNLDQLEDILGAASSRDIMLALTDVKYDATTADAGKTAGVPQWLGELWKPAERLRRIIPLISSGVLTDLVVKGYRWKTKPTVGKWSGNKTDIPSSAAAVEAYETTAQRWAGGNDIAIEYQHFGKTDVIEAIVRMLVESYMIQTDNDTLEKLLAAATPVTAGTTPNGIYANPLVWTVDGALALIEENATPSFAVVNPADYREIVLSPRDKVSEFLTSSFGLESGSTAGFQIVPHTGIAKGSALVGAREAATSLELPGAPVRVSALDIARGGWDEAVFGYQTTTINHPGALVLVKPAGTTGA